MLHKPASLAEARQQLDDLRGITHRLHAGVALAINGGVVWSIVEDAEMTFRAFSSAERDTVLALEGDAVLSSLGGYRLEGPSVRLFESIRGDYFAILGLPLLPLLAALRRYAPEVFAAGGPA
jgi:septum formation protein